MVLRFARIVFLEMGLPMPDLIECISNKLDDPIVMNWALHRYEIAQLQDVEYCQAMEKAWFHDVALRRWIDTDDHTVLEALFRILPSRLFANLKPAVIERWSSWSGGPGAGATTILIECPIGQVIPLLARHIETSVSDLEKTAAVISALTDLPGSDARRLLDDLTARISALPAKSFIRMIMTQALLRPTAALNPGAVVSLTETCARAVHDDTRDGDQLLRAVYVALFGNDALMTKARELINGAQGQPFHSFQPLFTAGAPLQDCDRILAEPEPWPKAKDLLEQHCGASAATETACAVAAIMQSQDVADLANTTCFAIGAVLRAFERDAIEVSGLSMEEALDILALDISHNRHAPTLTQHLAACATAELAQAVTKRLPSLRDEWGGAHLATLAGEMRLAETIPTLIDSLGSESGDFLCDAAQEALARIGEPAALALIAQWDELDSSQKIFGRGALERIGGDPAGRFAVERFQELFGDDQEGWCTWATVAPSERALDLIEPEIRRKQSIFDECFYLLSILTGREHFRLPDVRERIMQDRKRVLQRQSDFAAGHLGGPDDTVTLALKCEKCGDVNRYEVKSVVVATNGDTSPYFVRDDLRCLSCGAWADFEFTAEATMQMMAALIADMAEQGPAKADRKGPLELIDVHYRWEQRPAPEVMAELKAAVAEFPLNVVNHLRLGRFQYIFDRYGRAAECYRRALDLEPDCLEAGLGIANVMTDTGQRRIAFDKLCEMLDRGSKWRFFRTDELSPKGLTEDFTKLYNKLHVELGIRDLPLLSASSMRTNTKVGRNDPCPCGSSKKYKKCCGVAQAAMAL